MKAVLGLALLHLFTLVRAGEQPSAYSKGTTPPANPRVETTRTSVFLNRLFKNSVGAGQDVRPRHHEDLGSKPDTNTPLSVTVPGLQLSESTPTHGPANIQRGSILWNKLTQPSPAASLMQGNARDVEGSKLDELSQREANFRMRSMMLWLTSQLRAQQKLHHGREPSQKDRHQTAPRSGVETDRDDNTPRPITPLLETDHDDNTPMPITRQRSARVVGGGARQSVREDMMKNMTVEDLVHLLYHLWGERTTIVTTVVNLADTCCWIG